MEGNRIAIGRESLERDMAQGRYQLYYQPIVDLNTREYKGAEALMRHVDHQGEVMPPVCFVPEFEKLGLIYYLDCFVFHTVGGLLEKWFREGRRMKTISLNFSRQTLQWPGLFRLLESLSVEWSFPMEYMEVEITESIQDSGMNRMGHLVERLKDMKVKVALDDFGSKYSNAYSLMNTDLDVLKFDREMLKGVMEGEKGESVMRAIVGLCHHLGVKCTAEGVESQLQYDKLCELGCDYAQGYYVGYPMTLHEFSHFVGEI